MKITVVAGEGVSHNVRQKFRTAPVVEIADSDGKPLQGASVVFTLPDKGPGGTFEHGKKTLTLTADAQGRATAYGIHLNKRTGPFTIQVAATYQGQTANVAISETSVAGAKKPGEAFGVTYKTWVLVGLAAVVIAGAIVLAHNLKGGPNPNVLTATPGVPVVGGPQ